MQANLGMRRAARIVFGILGLAVLGGAAVVANTTDGVAETRPQPIAINIMPNLVAAEPDTVSAGEVTFQVTNRTSVTQDLRIHGPGADTKLDDIGPNGTRTLTMMVRAGTYDIRAKRDDNGQERQSLLTVLSN